MPLLYNQCGYLFRWVGAFHSREADYFIFHSDMGVTYPFHPPPFCLALPTVTQFSDWSHSSSGSLSASINGYRHHSLCPVYMFLLKFATISPYLWSPPILSGHSSRCPQYKPKLPVFPPQGSFTDRSLGDCLTTFLSDRGSLAWGGAGTPVPCMMAAHT